MCLFVGLAAAVVGARVAVRFRWDAANRHPDRHSRVLRDDPARLCDRLPRVNVRTGKTSASGHSEYGQGPLQRMTGFNLAAISLNRPDIAVHVSPPG
jgi:hypothetical protein